ncbi:MAG TPA: hypothetical protein VGP68_04210 [Gemmataceae bacterium]|jgi:hypothetical protein|nr:hypothetical protein [Gemmataceae bacterium]
MADSNQPKASVHSNGSVTVRQRPYLLLLRVQLRVQEATLELRLAKVKKLCQATSEWLKRLGANRVDFGEPFFADQTNDPMKRMGAVARAVVRKSTGTAAPERSRDVNVIVTATWNIASLSPEDTLVLVDRLWFDLVPETETPEGESGQARWSSPEEEWREALMQVLNQPVQDDCAPTFLFLSRLSEEDLDKAAAEAFKVAHRHAERLAKAAGRRLGEMGNIIGSPSRISQIRPDQLMQRQRCTALLAGTSFDLDEYEVVSDDLRAVDFTVGMSVTYTLE